ncbi:hypothetical protein [Methylomagnum sp.]
MSNFSLLAATRTIEKSMPFVLYRFAICFGVGLGFLLATLAGAGTLIGFGSLAKNAIAIGPLGAALGFAAFGYLMYKVRPVWLHGIQAPLLKLLADLAKGQTLPGGNAQIDYAKRQVSESFPSRSGLFEADRNVRSDLADLAASAAPVVVDSPVAKYQAKALGYLFGRNHQTILAWYFFAGAGDFQRTAAAGLAIQKQHYAALLKYRIIATIFEVVGLVAAYPLLLIGIEKLVSGIPINMGFWPYLFAGVFSWTLKAAFLEPIAEAAMLDGFFPLVPKISEAEAAPEPEAAPAAAETGEDAAADA